MIRRTFLKLFGLLAVPKAVSARPLFQTVSRFKKPAENHGDTWLYYAALLDAVPDQEGWTPTVLVRYRQRAEPKLGDIVTMSNGAYRYRITEVRKEPRLSHEDEMRLAGVSRQEMARAEGERLSLAQIKTPAYYEKAEFLN